MRPRVVQDWILVRGDTADVCQHRETYFEPGQDDVEMLVEVGSMGTDDETLLFVETAISDDAASWDELDTFQFTDAGESFVSLAGAGRYVRWRFHPGAAGDHACFRILARRRSSAGLVVPGSLRDPLSSCLQPWVTIIPVNYEGASSILSLIHI